MGDVALFRNLAEAERALLYRERRARLEQQLHAQRRHLRMLRRELDKAMAVDEVIETRLAEARTALACRDADAVYAWCADLSARLPRCRAFCRHKAVDALCATIIPALRRDGVACDLDIDLDDDCPLSSAELCALFANLLDNAGTACLALPRDRRWMTLRAHVVLDCLVIETRNAAASPPPRRFREDVAAHGRGSPRTDGACRSSAASPNGAAVRSMRRTLPRPAVGRSSSRGWSCPARHNRL